LIPQSSVRLKAAKPMASNEINQFYFSPLPAHTLYEG
jgi:hypothetical protein